MKRIGILTIIDNDNYGNRLQNYSVQKVLMKYDFYVETILNEPFSNTKKNYLLRMIKNINNKGKISSNLNRKNNFNLFNKNILFSKNKYNPFKKNNDYDFYIVGSDQVWNPNISRLRDADLLSTVPSCKRISFSASFGVDYVSEKFSVFLENQLSKFKAISVREDAGKKIINSILPNKDVQVLVDPTMLLDADEWGNVALKPKMLKHEKFILNYFLGELSSARKKEIERIAKENDCQIINILDKESPFYECGPSEFLWLEKNAFLICTDSFHSSVFAILYNRPFIIFDREQEGVVSMNSRLDTLISKFNLKNRKFEGVITDENLNHDYSEAYKILEIERQKSKDFLERALDIKK